MTPKIFKEAVFYGLLAALLLLIYLAIAFSDHITRIAIIAAFLVLMVLLFKKYDMLLMLKEYERAVIFRLGRLNRVGGPGWCLMVPVLESANIVDLRVKTIDVSRQEIITKDGIEVEVDAVIYMSVKKDKQSVINSVIEVDDYVKAASTYVVASIRDVGGDMTLTEVISQIELLNKRLKENLSTLTKGWGVNVEAVEMKDVNIPRTVLDAMHEEKAAVQRKLAKFEEAEAKRYEIEAIKKAAEELSDKTLSYYYIKALEEIAKGKSTKFIFPLELSRLAENISSKIGGAVSKKEIQEELVDKYKEVIAEEKGKKKAKPKKKAKK